TRFSRDWSSDVCSSDLVGKRQDAMVHLLHHQAVQVQKISRYAQLVDGARAALKGLDPAVSPETRRRQSDGRTPARRISSPARCSTGASTACSSAVRSAGLSLSRFSSLAIRLRAGVWPEIIRCSRSRV